MSADTNRSKMDLETLFDNLAEAVEHAPPEDLLAEAKVAGQDTERIEANVKNTLLDAVRNFEQRKLHAARHAYRERSTELSRKRFALPDSAVERRKMLIEAAATNQRVARVTAKFRDLRELSDEDVRSALEDLMDLGAFDQSAELYDDGNK
jgi:hypothetical protein